MLRQGCKPDLKLQNLNIQLQLCVWDTAFQPFLPSAVEFLSEGAWNNGHSNNAPTKLMLSITAALSILWSWSERFLKHKLSEKFHPDQ